jgi:hypothetical protein
MIGKGVLWRAMVGRVEKHLNYASYVVPEPCMASVGGHHLVKTSEL